MMTLHFEYESKLQAPFYHCGIFVFFANNHFQSALGQLKIKKKKEPHPVFEVLEPAALPQLILRRPLV